MILRDGACHGLLNVAEVHVHADKDVAVFVDKRGQFGYRKETMMRIGTHALRFLLLASGYYVVQTHAADPAGCR